MLFPPGKKCDRCDQPFKEGESLRIVNVGKLEKIGGLGLYKDHVTFRGTERVEHDGPCPAVYR